jgi:hypothetical protein
MVGAANGGIVFRKEDIDMMSFSGVNGQFAPEGQSVYSIWKWKGGAFLPPRLEAFGLLPQAIRAASFCQTKDWITIRLSSTEKAIKDGVPTNKLVPNGWDEAQKRPIDTPSHVVHLKYR